MLAQIVTSIESRSLNKPFTYKVPLDLEGVIALGQCVLIPFGKSNRLIEGYVIDILEEEEALGINLKEIKEVVLNKTTANSSMLKLAKEISEYYFISYSSALKLVIVSVGKEEDWRNSSDIGITKLGQETLPKLRKSKKKTFLEALEENTCSWEKAKGQVGLKTLKELLDAEMIVLIKRVLNQEACLKNLNGEQEKAYQEIARSLDEEKNQVFLLFGVTGSGKTEVYLKSIEKALKKGKQALILLPEISLTEQMIHRFTKAFPNNVVKWHSQMSLGAKKKIQSELLSGEKNILVGSRSAIFTSMNNLGLIIVDEEHDTSYYQNSMPIYDGRNVALMRGRIEQATVVLGSGTPSLDSIYQVKAKEYDLLTLKEKFHGTKNPHVEIISMADELRSGNFSIISQSLKNTIQEKILLGEQVLLFLNRRGYSNFLLCRDCGYVAKCEACDISLTYHQGKNKLVCHYCSREIDVLKECPECKSKRIKGIGLGTEQTVAILKEMFPQAKIARLDRDIKGGIAGKQEIIEAFKKGETDILVGTQMITKGIDFPNIGLVGILLGDTSLNFPDYRSREWTFSLLMQVIGRTGRRQKDGLVLLQTYRPFDIIFREIKNFNYQDFYKKELDFRQRMQYPPYSEIFKLHIMGEDENGVIKKSWDIYEELKSSLSENIIFKPVKSKIGKVNYVYRWQIILKVKKGSDDIELFFKKYLPTLYQDNNKKVFCYLERNPRGLL